jgi:hypothetical protein
MMARATNIVAFVAIAIIIIAVVLSLTLTLTSSNTTVHKQELSNSNDDEVVSVLPSTPYSSPIQSLPPTSIASTHHVASHPPSVIDTLTLMPFTPSPSSIADSAINQTAFQVEEELSVLNTIEYNSRCEL